MSWGAPRGVHDLIEKLRNNTTAETICILRTRKFGSTDVVAFASALGTNTSLGELLASGHYLGVPEASLFGKALSTNTSLRVLCIGDDKFGDEAVSALVRGGLKDNVGLEVLDLEYKSISCGESLGLLLRAHPTLVELKLGRNRLAEAGMKDICLGLSENTTLRRLDLSGNSLNALAAEALGRALSTTSGDDKDDSAGSAGVIPHLESLDLSRNPLGDEGGAALFGALAHCSSLRSLKLAESGLGTGAANALAQALAPVHSGGQAQPGLRPPVSRGLFHMKALDLSKNELGAAGAVSLAEALGRGGAPHLASLSLGYNEIQDEGACALGRAAGPSFRLLDLGGNGLSGEGIASVVCVAGLREAKLFHNSCGDEGVPCVLDALRNAGQLQTLDLGANGLTGAGFEMLLPRLAECESLCTIELGANSNDERAEAAVRLSQAKHPKLDIAFRRGGEAMEGMGAAPSWAAAETAQPGFRP